MGSCVWPRWHAKVGKGLSCHTLGYPAIEKIRKNEGLLELGLLPSILATKSVRSERGWGQAERGPDCPQGQTLTSAMVGGDSKVT